MPAAGGTTPRRGAPTGTCHNILTQTCCENAAYTSYPQELPVPPEVAPKSGGRPACGLLGLEPWLLGLYHAFRRRRATGGR